MKLLAALVPCALIAGSLLPTAASAQSRPIPINDSARIVVPAPYVAMAAAIDGDSILVTANDFEGAQDALFHYRRTASGWQLERTLLQLPQVSPEAGLTRLVAARGGVAAVQFGGQLAVFERSGSSWVPRPVVQPSEEIVGSTLDVEGGRIQVGISRCSASAALFAKNTSGTYVQTNRLTGMNMNCNSLGHSTGYLSGGYAVNRNPDGSLWIFRRDGNAFEWPHVASIARRRSFNGYVGIADPFLVVGGFSDHTVFQRGATPNTWNQLGTFSPLDRDYHLANTYGLRLRDGYVLTEIQSYYDNSLLHAWRANGDGTFTHVATLRTPDRTWLTTSDISGRTVISYGAVGDRATVFVFELPEDFTTPAPLHDDFEGASQAQWSPLPGSQLAVVSNGRSRVYRQSNLTVDAGALLEDTDWQHHAVQADLKPTQFNGTDRWFGLVARWQDNRNFYYVTLRSSNRVALRRMVNGVIRELASAPLAVTAGQTYRVRLETRGAELIATVDGAPPLRAVDRSLTHGVAGFAGYRTGYDIDNVTVSPLATHLFYVHPSNNPVFSAGEWTLRGGWSTTGPSSYFSQPDTNIEGHAVIGQATDDEIVATRARIDSFNPATASGWVGVMTRYVDNKNYYSLALRSNNQLQLRRTVGGTVSILAGRGFTVTPGRFYDLRLEAVGGRLRAYVNGEFQVEATDSTFARGRTGLATYKSAASFSGYDAYQP